MREAVIVEALRTPIARGKLGRGDLSGFHPTQLLGRLQRSWSSGRASSPATSSRSSAAASPRRASSRTTSRATPGSSREQGLHHGGTTVDTQCGSGQQANHLVTALVRAGSIDAGIACGIEVMSHVGLGANVMNGPGFFQPPDWPWDTPPSQFVSGRAHREQARHHARGGRPLRAALAAAGRSRRATRDASSARSCRSTRPCSATTASPPARRGSWSRTRASARRRSRRSRS